MEKREIELVPPDPAWPERFAVERATIVAALGAKAIRVDHIGSTSIPGIAAKPIIDIDLSVKDATIWLSIRDDGKGEADPGRGSGLLSITDRVEALGGGLQIMSPVGGGTSPLAEIPIADV